MPTISSPDRHLILNNFSRAAGRYDEFAIHHRRIAVELIEMIKHSRPGSVLELGCGTGILSKMLNGLFPCASKVFTDGASGMVKVCRTKVPPSFLVRHTIWNFEESECTRLYDLVVSSCAAQWVIDPVRFTEKIASLVAPGGSTAHAIPVKGMLKEFQHSFEQTGAKWNSLNYLTGNQWNELFRNSGFRIVESRTHPVSVGFSSPCKALRALNGIGASLSGHRESSSTEPGMLRRALRKYSSDFKDQRGIVPSTYSVHFLKAVRHSD